MEESTAPTLVLPMACCSCKAGFREKLKGGGTWRHKSEQVPGITEQIRVYLCPACAGRFASDDGVEQYLCAVVDELVSGIRGEAG